MVHWSRQQIISSCCRGQHTSKQGNSGQDRPLGGLMTWDHQGLPIGKNRPQAFDKPNFLICLDLAFKPDLQIYSYHLLRTRQYLREDWVTCLVILSSLEMPPLALCCCMSHPRFKVKLKPISLEENSQLKVGWSTMAGFNSQGLPLKHSFHHWSTDLVCSPTVPGVFLLSPQQFIKLSDFRPNGLYFSASPIVISSTYLPWMQAQVLILSPFHKKGPRRTLETFIIQAH